MGEEWAAAVWMVEKEESKPAFRERMLMDMCCIGVEVILVVIECCLLSTQQLCCVL